MRPRWIRIMILILVVFVLASACASKVEQTQDEHNEVQTGPNKQNQDEHHDNQQDQPEQPQHKQNEVQTDPDTLSPVNDEVSEPSHEEEDVLIASIPEKDIFLYGRSNGVLLKVGSMQQEFDWLYMTPRAIMPVMQVYDLDADGEEELVINLYIGSGTGVSVEELHVVEIGGTDGLTDYVFDTYGALIEQELSFRTDEHKDIITGEIIIGSTSYKVDLTEYRADYGAIGDKLIFGDIVSFDNQEGSLSMEIGLGIVVEQSVMPQYIGYLHADVHYQDGAFRLSHLRFTTEDDRFAYEFPDRVDLTFESASLTKLASIQLEASWEWKKSVPFGRVDGADVELLVYEDADTESFCRIFGTHVVLLKHKDRIWEYKECLSATIVEAEEPLQNGAVILMDSTNDSNDAGRTLHGAIELGANGPGLMVYVIYDHDEESWWGLDVWGTPAVVDLDGDGSEEIVSQFNGLHMHWPDVTIFRLREHDLERSNSVKNALMVPNYSFSSATFTSARNGSEIVVSAVLTDGMDDGHAQTARYRYAARGLVKLPHRTPNIPLADTSVQFR